MGRHMAAVRKSREEEIRQLYGLPENFMATEEGLVRLLEIAALDTLVLENSPERNQLLGEIVRDWCAVAKREGW